MDKLLEQAPKIIAESSKTPLGIVSLSILVLSVLGYLFFHAASDAVRISMFILMFAGYGLLNLTILRTAGARQADASPQPTAGVSQDTPPVVAVSRGAGSLRRSESAARSVTLLTRVWYVGSGVVVLLLSAQTLFGKWGEHSEMAWAWLGPNLVSGLTIVTVASVFGAVPGRRTISQSTHRAALMASVLYLLFLALTLLVEPLLSVPTEQLFQFSSLVATPLQGFVAVALTAWLLSGLPSERN